MQTYLKIGKGLAKCVVVQQLTDTQVAVRIDRQEHYRYTDDDGLERAGWRHVGAVNMVVSKYRIVDGRAYGDTQ